MKRLIFATVALSILAAPAAFAAERRHFDSQPRHEMRHQPPKPSRSWHSEPAKPHWDAKKPHWKKGQRVSNWKQRQSLKDWKRYGLRKPGRGQEWVRVGNDYLLISIGNGLIFSFISR